MADEVNAAGAYAPVVARMRTRRRARHDRFSPFPAIRATPVHATSSRRGAVGQLARRRVLAGAVALWLLCLAAPWSLGLAMHRAALLPMTDPIAPSDSPLDGLLIRLLTMTPTGYIHAYAGTAEVAAWSPDGRYLVAGYSSGRLLLWDSAHQGRVALRVWQARRGAVSALAWSPDGRLLASAGAGSAALWRIGPGTAPARLWAAPAPSAAGVRPAVAFSPDGRALAIADGIGTIGVWRLTCTQRGVDPATSGPMVLCEGRRLMAPGRTTALAWSGDGAYLAVGTVEGRVSVWHTAGGKGARQAWPSVTRALGSHIWALAWSPALPTLAVGGSDGTVRLLAGSNLGQLALLSTPFRTVPVLKAPDAGGVATGGALSKGGASGKGVPGRGPRLAAGAAINAVQWSPGGQALAITETGVPLRLWQPSRGVAATYDENWDMNAVAWRPGGSDVALAADDGSLTVLRVAPPDALARTTRPASGSGCKRCAPLGRRIGLPVLSPPSYMSR